MGEFSRANMCYECLDSRRRCARWEEMREVNLDQYCRQQASHRFSNRTPLGTHNRPPLSND